MKIGIAIGDTQDEDTKKIVEKLADKTCFVPKDYLGTKNKNKEEDNTDDK